MTEIQTPRGAVVTVQTGNGKTTAKLVWNPNFASKYTAKFDKVQKFIDSECLRYSDKLVPMKTGMLKNPVHWERSSAAEKFVILLPMLVINITGDGQPDSVDDFGSNE